VKRCVCEPQIRALPTVALALPLVELAAEIDAAPISTLLGVAGSFL
jgi:hypothetical protein